MFERSAPWILEALEFRTLGRVPSWTGDETLPALLTHRRRELGMWAIGGRCIGGAQGLDILHVCHLLSTRRPLDLRI